MDSLERMEARLQQDLASQSFSRRARRALIGGAIAACLAAGGVAAFGVADERHADRITASLSAIATAEAEPAHSSAAACAPAAAQGTSPAPETSSPTPKTPPRAAPGTGSVVKPVKTPKRSLSPATAPRDGGSRKSLALRTQREHPRSASGKSTPVRAAKSVREPKADRP